VHFPYLYGVQDGGRSKQKNNHFRIAKGLLNNKISFLEC